MSPWLAYLLGVITLPTVLAIAYAGAWAIDMLRPHGGDGRRCVFGCDWGIPIHARSQAAVTLAWKWHAYSRQHRRNWKALKQRKEARK